MLEEQWVYDKDDIFKWNEYSDNEVAVLWNYDVANFGAAYNLRNDSINSIDVKFYNVISFNLFLMPNGFVQEVFANRFVYEIYCKEDPTVVEEELRHRRVGSRLFFGRFKTLDEAINHANKRTKLLAQEDASDIITDSFGLLDLEPPDKLFDIYIPRKDRTSNLYGFDIDYLTVYNTYDNKFENMYKVNVPFIRVKMSGTRNLFGLNLILDGNESGLSMYFGKSFEPVFESMTRINDQILSVFLPEIILTKKKYGPDVMEGFFDEDEEDDYELT